MKIIFIIFLFVISAVTFSSIVSAEDNRTLKLLFQDSSGSVNLITNNGRYEVYLYQIYLENETKNRIPMDLIHIRNINPYSTENFRVGNRDISYGYYTIKIIHWTEVKNAPSNTELLPMVITDETRIINFTNESKIYPVFLHEINGEPETLIMFRTAEESLNLAKWALFAAIISLLMSFFTVYYKLKKLPSKRNFKYPRCITINQRFSRIDKDYKLSAKRDFVCLILSLCLILLFVLRSGYFVEVNEDSLWITDVLMYAFFAVILSILNMDDIKN